MRKILVTLLSTVAMMGIASLAFAADGAPVKLDSASLGLAVFGCAIGMAVAAAGCGIGQGLGLKSACEGIARNPDAAGKIQVSLILGLAFPEPPFVALPCTFKCLKACSATAWRSSPPARLLKHAT